MIDFATLKGVTIPEGVVTQIESGDVVLWKTETSKPVVLEVEKITSDTYAGETTYTGEQFILLDIYPKTNGTVNVTYGGLTKTITDTSGAAEPNAQQVFFGTFNGVSDSVETPASGTLTIEGGYYAFAKGTFASSSKNIAANCGCITAVTDWGSVTTIANSAFSGCTGLSSVNIPDTVTTIANKAFSGCTGLSSVNIPDTVTTIADWAFSGCTGLSSVNIPDTVTTIADSAFSDCTGLSIDGLPDSLVEVGAKAFLEISSINISALPNGLQRIGDKAFYTSSDSSNVMTRTFLTFPALPSGLTYLGSYGCCGNDALTIDTLPPGLTAVSNYAFRACLGLTKIVIGENITSIGDYAFAYCNNLVDITIGKNVATIGESVFHSYSKNAKITFLSSIPPTFENAYYTFGTLDNNTIESITVPAGSGEAYKTALSNYADYIVEAS